MPGMTGFEACSKIRNVLRWPDHHDNGPGDEEQDTKVVAFDSGADDYVVKPFGVNPNCWPRIRAALRRSSADETLSKLDSPELSFDFGMRLVTVRGKRVYLQSQ